jgi:putative oxidoreductase
MTLIKTIALWLVQVLMAVPMVGSGLDKFTGPNWQRMFRVWGYPEHFYLVIGGIEVVAGLGLLVPKTATPSALILMVVMIGAAITQMLHGRNGVGELVFCTLLGIIAYVRRPSWLKLPRRIPATAVAQR